MSFLNKRTLLLTSALIGIGVLASLWVRTLVKINPDQELLSRIEEAIMNTEESLANILKEDDDDVDDEEKEPKNTTTQIISIKYDGGVKRRHRLSVFFAW